MWDRDLWPRPDEPRSLGVGTGDDQLRDRLWHLRPRCACVPPRWRAALSSLPDAFRAVGGEAWLVGGAVRDQLLGRPTSDFDVALQGEPARTARSVARTLGAH